jgi:acetyltransferase-like isoleucine patch superfamily enzyme
VSTVKNVAEALGVKPALSRVKDRTFPAAEGLRMVALDLIGQLPSAVLRHAGYRRMGMAIGARSRVYRGLEVRFPGRVTIGDSTMIGFDSIIDGRAGVTIGNNVNFSSEVAIWTLQHDPQARDFDARGGPVVIEDDAWLSFRCTILPGVTIGRGAVVAAGAIVTKDVEPYTMVGGIPAKQIGERTRDLDYDLGAIAGLWFV